MLLFSGTCKKRLIVQEVRLHASPSDNLATEYARVSYCETALDERIDIGAGQNNCCISCDVMISLFFDRNIDSRSSTNSASSSTCHWNRLLLQPLLIPRYKTILNVLISRYKTNLVDKLLIYKPS